MKYFSKKYRFLIPTHFFTFIFVHFFLGGRGNRISTKAFRVFRAERSIQMATVKLLCVHTLDAFLV